MAENPRAVRRYTAALYKAAEAGDAVDQVQEDLRLISSTLHQYPELQNALLQGVTPDAAKKRVIRSLFGERISVVSMSFLELLVDKRREDVLLNVEAAYRKIADERRGVRRATVTSAVPLSDAEVQELRQSLGRMLKQEVDVDVEVDSEIIGGLVIRVGDRLIDGSVRGEINRLHKALSGQA